jgi:hypothetical protein
MIGVRLRLRTSSPFVFSLSRLRQVSVNVLRRAAAGLR